MDTIARLNGKPHVCKLCPFPISCASGLIMVIRQDEILTGLVPRLEPECFFCPYQVFDRHSLMYRPLQTAVFKNREKVNMTIGLKWERAKTATVCLCVFLVFVFNQDSEILVVRDGYSADDGRLDLG